MASCLSPAHTFCKSGRTIIVRNTRYVTERFKVQAKSAPTLDWPLKKEFVKRNTVQHQQLKSGFGKRSTAEEVTNDISLDSQVIVWKNISIDTFFVQKFKKLSGGSAGIGFETARVLAMRGAHVIIACENLREAERSALRILKENPNAKVTGLHLNLGSLYSVREFVSTFKSLNLPLQVLVNNAGIASSQFVRSEDGLEMTFAVNHVGHFLLTNLLLDLMEETAVLTGSRGRIVIVSSSQHDSANGIDFTNLHTRSWMFSVPVLQSVHGLTHVYAQSKLANILHAKELARRLDKQGKGEHISVNALHPGVFNTSFVEKFAQPAGLAFSWVEPLLKTVEQGAATTCYLAAHPDVEGVSGKYFVDCAQASGNKASNDMQLALELWNYTQELVRPYETRDET